MKMREYVIVTDSGCDIRREVLKEWGVPSVDLTFKFDEEDIEHTEADVDTNAFYQRMREGAVAKTAAINPHTFRACFEEILKAGKDILYFGFSSGLSTTYNSARMAAEELADEYPEGKVITVDTLCASAGQGLLVYMTLKKQKEGFSLEEAATYSNEMAPKISHCFTVDDLVYLKRGGRISPTVAFVGGVLGIKPVLHVDEEGHLVSVSKAKGRKAALNALVRQLEETILDRNEPVFISSADCIEDTQWLKYELETNHGVKVEHITDIGPVIGAHAGPGTMALFFVGTKR